MRLLDSKYQRAALLILVLGVALIIALFPFVTGLIGIPVLYVIFSPLYRAITPPVRSSISAGLVTLVALITIVIPLVVITGILVSEAPEMARRILNSDAIARIAGMQIGPYEIGPELVNRGQALVAWLGGGAIGLIGTATRISLNVLIALFGLYYLLINADETWNALTPYIPFSPANSRLLRTRFKDVTNSTLIGTGLTAAVQGVLVGIAFKAAGLANPTFWGIITVFLAVLPVVGSGLVWIPGVLVLALDQRYLAAALLAAAGVIVIANVDNIIRPIVFRRWARIHPLVTLVGAFAGIRYFGLLGLLVGPLALSYFFELIRMYQEEFIQRRRLGESPVSRRSGDQPRTGTPEHRVSPEVSAR